MTEETKSIVKATKHSIWKYFGAMFMERKNGYTAVSLTRLLALVSFVVLNYMLLTGKLDSQWAVYTFFGLVTGKTAESVMAIWKGKKAQ